MKHEYKKTFPYIYEKAYLKFKECNYLIYSSEARDDNNPPASK